MSENGTNPYQNIPEPSPIVVDPALDERARDFLRAVTLDRIDRNLFSERLKNRLTATRFDEAANYAAALGSVQEMYAFEQRTTAEGVATYYRVRYPSEILTWVFSVDPAGSINGFALRRSPRNKIYNIWLRDVAY